MKCYVGSLVGEWHVSHLFWLILTRYDTRWTIWSVYRNFVCVKTSANLLHTVLRNTALDFIILAPKDSGTLAGILYNVWYHSLSYQDTEVSSLPFQSCIFTAWTKIFFAKNDLTCEDSLVLSKRWICSFPFLCFFVALSRTARIYVHLQYYITWNVKPRVKDFSYVGNCDYPFHIGDFWHFPFFNLACFYALDLVFSVSVAPCLSLALLVSPSPFSFAFFKFWRHFL